MKLFSALSLAVSILALGISFIALQKTPAVSETKRAKVASVEDLVLTRLTSGSEWAHVDSDAAFWSEHRAEISRTLKIADQFEKADLGLFLVRYEAGGKVFREGVWCRKFKGQWLLTHVSKYADNSFPKDLKDWVEEMATKEELWSKDTASKWY